MRIAFCGEGPFRSCRVRSKKSRVGRASLQIVSRRRRLVDWKVDAQSNEIEPLHRVVRIGSEHRSYNRAVVLVAVQYNVVPSVDPENIVNDLSFRSSFAADPTRTSERLSFVRLLTTHYDYCERKTPIY